MEPTSSGQVGDLLAATEAVGDDQCVIVDRPDGRQQDTLSDGDRDVVILGLEAKRAGHSATTGVEDFEVEPHLLE
jgi:uncharacterized Zn-binding protein involved in type VI secretion